MSQLFLGRHCYTNTDYSEEKRKKYPDHKLCIDNGASINRPYFIHPNDVEKWEGKYGLTFYSYNEYLGMSDER